MKISGARIQKNKGFSLMEVLIAIIVIAIGLLGFLTLQLTSINSNQDGLFRSQATLISQELASRMRANRDYIYDEEGDSEYLVNANYNSCNTAPALICGDGEVCTSKQQARYDAYEICQIKNGFTAAANTESDDLFPISRVAVGCTTRDSTRDANCSSGSTHTIYVFWAAAAKRQDAGQVASFRNSRCNSFAEDEDAVDVATLASEVDCTVTDIMP